MLMNDESDFIGCDLRTAMPTLHKYTQISYMTCRFTQGEACSISALAAAGSSRAHALNPWMLLYLCSPYSTSGGLCAC